MAGDASALRAGHTGAILAARDDGGSVNHERTAIRAVVLGVLRNEPLQPLTRLDLSHRPDLLNAGDGIRPVSLYDQLHGREEVAA